MAHPITFRSDRRLMPGTAEPRIEIDGALLGLFERWPSDDAILERPEEDGPVAGSLLKLRYKGSYLVWRITGEVYPADTYHEAIWAAEWPD
jgi:hypothetical protein